MATLAAIIGRICIAVLFVLAGIGKLMDPAGTAQYITAHTSFSGQMAVPAGVFEIAVGLVLASGFMTRLAAVLLIGFTAFVTVLFHNQVTDPQVAQQALKNLAIIGGLLMVFAYGQVRGTLGTWRERDRARDAEIRAARAEGRAEGAENVATHETTVVHEERPVDRPRL